MHDFDRTSLESGFQEYENDENGYEYEEQEQSYGESPFNEAEEMELAAELLTLSTDQELDQFLGKLFKQAGRAVGKFVKSPLGQQIGGIVKGAAKTALPMLGSAVGNALLPGIGGMVGGQLASTAGSMLGLELEGLSQEDQEFEAAKQIVRFAGAAASNAAQAPPNAPPRQVVQNAVTSAAQQYAPGLLRPNGQATTQNGKHLCKHASSGRWIRRGGAIVILGA
jgi:hypothetical protein